MIQRVQTIKSFIYFEILQATVKCILLYLWAKDFVSTIQRNSCYLAKQAMHVCILVFHR